MKTCTACGAMKTLDQFYSNGRNGLHTACKECAKSAARKARQLHPELHAQRDKLKHEKHRDARLVKMREYNRNNAEKRAELERKRYESDREARKQKARDYRACNLHKVMAINGKRRARMKQATPAWADMGLIACMYRLASIYTDATGTQYHVDHIVPLNGKTVSGLHVQDNLRVLPAAENIRKGARLL